MRGMTLLFIAILVSVCWWQPTWSSGLSVAETDKDTDKYTVKITSPGVFEAELTRLSSTYYYLKNDPQKGFNLTCMGTFVGGGTPNGFFTVKIGIPEWNGPGYLSPAKEMTLLESGPARVRPMRPQPGGVGVSPGHLDG